MRWVDDKQQLADELAVGDADMWSAKKRSSSLTRRRAMGSADDGKSSESAYRFFVVAMRKSERSEAGGGCGRGKPVGDGLGALASPSFLMF